MEPLQLACFAIAAILFLISAIPFRAEDPPTNSYLARLVPLGLFFLSLAFIVPAL